MSPLLICTLRAQPPGEGILGALLDCIMDHGTDIVKLAQYLQIGKAKNRNPPAVQICAASLIAGLLLRLVVLGAIQFHCQFGCVAIKIHNVIPDDILPTKAQRIFPEEMIPEQSFFLGLVFPEGTCIPG